MLNYVTTFTITMWKNTQIMKICLGFVSYYSQIMMFMLNVHVTCMVYMYLLIKKILDNHLISTELYVLVFFYLIYVLL
jgi:hypothetical protein